MGLAGAEAERRGLQREKERRRAEGASLEEPDEVALLVGAPGPSIWEQLSAGVEDLSTSAWVEQVAQTWSENVDLERSEERSRLSERRRGLLRRLRGEPSSLFSRCRAEFFGTCYIFLLGSAVANLGVGFLCSAIAWGFAVGSAVAAGASVSGAHYNPAVTVAMAFGDAFAARDALPYLASQYGGAMLAGGVLTWLFPLSAGLPAASGGLASEALVTALLLYGCLSVGDGVESGRISRSGSPLLIGCLICFLNVVFAHLRVGLNPAMLAGPRLVAAFSGYGAASAMAGACAYTLGPILGGILGGSLFAFGSGRGVGGSSGVYGAIARLGRSLSPWYGAHWDMVEEPPTVEQVMRREMRGVVVPTRIAPKVSLPVLSRPLRAADADALTGEECVVGAGFDFTACVDYHDHY